MKMIYAKDLKELLKGVPDDAEIFIPSKEEDLWENCSNIEINYEYVDHYPYCVDNEGKKIYREVLCNVTFIREREGAKLISQFADNDTLQSAT